MKKIKILHIIKSLGRGGAEMLLPETLKSHDKDQFEFHYIYFLPWKNQLVSAIIEAGGTVTLFSANNNIQILLQFPKIIKYCKENEIQIIHAHLPWAGFVSRIVYFFTKITTFYTEHNLQERYHFITRLINKITFNFQTVGIGVSLDVTNSIKKNINPKIENITLLNGVNCVNFNRNDANARINIRNQYGIPLDGLVVGTVAVFRFQKRLDLWLDVVAKAIQENPNVYGIIVGAGPLESVLIEKHQALNLEGKVFFAGLQSEVKPFYEAMDYFMMCSSFEGLPIALLEAMSMECAILSTNAGGIKEVVRPSLDGVVVDVDEWEELSKSLVQLSFDSSNTLQFQHAARERVKTAFSIEIMVENLETLYKSHL
jgi:glycosyltransferase involved in cell wall biosynthesis